MRNKEKTVVVIGTMDTKGLELAYLAEQIKAAGCRTLLMDVGTRGESGVTADIPVEKVVGCIGEKIEAIRSLPRGDAVEKMCRAAAACLNQIVDSGKAHRFGRIRGHNYLLRGHASTSIWNPEIYGFYPGFR